MTATAEPGLPAMTLDFEVRDYECDMEGIVNNAVYLHYLEHARHHYLKRIGLNFAELTRAGVHLVVIRAEVDYLAPLRSGDLFTVRLWTERVSRLRFAFLQDIVRPPQGETVLRARVLGTALTAAGRPVLTPAIDAAFGPVGADVGGGGRPV